MRVFIAGIDGYLGWPLAQYLTARGHEVAGLDLLLRRQWAEEAGVTALCPYTALMSEGRHFNSVMIVHWIFVLAISWTTICYAVF